MKPNILLVGHFPEPIGGVSIHLLRLSQLLGKRAASLSFTGVLGTNVRRVVSFGGISRLLRGAGVLHYHTDERDWKKAVLVALWCVVRQQRLMITLHSFRVTPEDSPLQLRSWKFISSVCERIVCISEDMRTRVESIVGTSLPLVVVPSFLPISEFELARSLPEHIEECCSKWTTTLVFNAYRSVLWNGLPLYGEDLLVHLAKYLMKHHSGVGIVAVFATSDHDAATQRHVAELDALDNVLLLDDFGDFLAPVLAKADLSLRLTRDDGGKSLTVLEAEQLGITCVASDAVPRGDYPLVFASGNADSLCEVVTKALATQQTHIRSAAETPLRSEDYLRELYGGDYD